MPIDWGEYEIVGETEEPAFNKIDYLKWYVEGFKPEDLSNPEAVRLLSKGYSQLNDLLMQRGDITPEEQAILNKYQQLLAQSSMRVTGYSTYMIIGGIALVAIIVLLLLFK